MAVTSTSGFVCVYSKNTQKIGSCDRSYLLHEFGVIQTAQKSSALLRLRIHSSRI